MGMTKDEDKNKTHQNTGRLWVRRRSGVCLIGVELALIVGKGTLLEGACQR